MGWVLDESFGVGTEVIAVPLGDPYAIGLAVINGSLVHVFRDPKPTTDAQGIDILSVSWYLLPATAVSLVAISRPISYGRFRLADICRCFESARLPFMQNGPSKQVVRYCCCLALCFCTLFLSSCSSGSNMSSSGTGTTTGSSAPAAASRIYDFQSTASSNVIGIFSATASGAAPPEATLVLPTDFTSNALVTDSTGQIYVGGQGSIGGKYGGVF